MDDRERIEALAADGRITREEADGLLSVLDDIDRTEQGLDGIEYDSKVEQESVSDRLPAPPPAPPTPPRPETPPGPAGGRSDSPPADHARDELRWVEVHLLAGDLEIVVDPGISKPTVSSSGNGETRLEATERGFKLGGGWASGPKDRGLLERLLSNVTRGTVKLSVPPAWGVKLDMKAGDVEISGPLAFLEGNLLAGDLDADQLQGVDLSVRAGDVDLGLLLTGGNHLVRTVAGDLNVRLLPGCDVTAHGRVNIGDISLDAGWERSRRGLGWTFEHALGSGSARLALELGTGDLEVRHG